MPTALEEISLKSIQNESARKFDLTARTSLKICERVAAVTNVGSPGYFSPISNLSRAKDFAIFLALAKISYLLKVIKKL